MLSNFLNNAGKKKRYTQRQRQQLQMGDNRQQQQQANGGSNCKSGQNAIYPTSADRSMTSSNSSLSNGTANCNKRFDSSPTKTDHQHRCCRCPKFVHSRSMPQHVRTHLRAEFKNFGQFLCRGCNVRKTQLEKMQLHHQQNNCPSPIFVKVKDSGVDYTLAWMQCFPGHTLVDDCGSDDDDEKKSTATTTTNGEATSVEMDNSRLPFVVNRKYERSQVRDVDNNNKSTSCRIDDDDSSKAGYAVASNSTMTENNDHKKNEAIAISDDQFIKLVARNGGADLALNDAISFYAKSVPNQCSGSEILADFARFIAQRIDDTKEFVEKITEMKSELGGDNRQAIKAVTASIIRDYTRAKTGSTQEWELGEILSGYRNWTRSNLQANFVINTV